MAAACAYFGQQRYSRLFRQAGAHLAAKICDAVIFIDGDADHAIGPSKSEQHDEVRAPTHRRATKMEEGTHR